MPCINSVGLMRTIFVDFRRAFDFVNRNILFKNFKSTTHVTFNLCSLVLIDQTANIEFDPTSPYLPGRNWRAVCLKSPGRSRWIKMCVCVCVLGSLSFLVLIDDLTTGRPVYKYIDDSTLSEVLQPKSSNSSVMNFLKKLAEWDCKQWYAIECLWN